METLETLAKTLRRCELCAQGKALLSDVRIAIATDRATDAEILEMKQRAVSLGYVRADATECIV